MELRVELSVLELPELRTESGTKIGSESGTDSELIESETDIGTEIRTEGVCN